MAPNDRKSPYYAVIFTSVSSRVDEGYDQTANDMARLAAEMPGFLGLDSARNEVGITVSYWETLDDIARWRHQADHAIARRQGREKWYESFSVSVCKVERSYSFHA